MIDEKTSVSEIMRRAYKNGILIPAFNVAHLPMIKPIVDTLKEMRTFALVEVARPDVERFGAKSFQSVADEYGSLADRRFSRLHLDHIPVIDEDGKKVDWIALIKMGLALGYDSVMIDGSRLPLEENVAITREVVELSHGYGRPVEAELGAVLGHEAGPLPPYEELFRSGRGFTDPEDAERFVRETGVDWLSVAIGNIHGAISGVAKDKKKISARLNIDHLKRINRLTKIPLVLHGGSGIPKGYVMEAVKNGITKMNIGTSIRQAYERSLLEKPDDVEAAQEEVAVEVKRLIEEYEVEGSWERL
ncbi:hypothetical protein DRZ78_04675 [Candidatus Aerophobetes bacterium]|uniref:Class II fructose-bisphosphate aldolase n=1 Tax=Aerophobetes bacterium TaxID=2030807 RepID=A0A662D2H0_UNCAE|nr:MAG: hypothetical protein DRZ78_04675 [Candidatus Aerophobetes bacterium]